MNICLIGYEKNNDLTISIGKEYVHCCPDQAEEDGASLHRVLTSLTNWDQIHLFLLNPTKCFQIQKPVKGIHFLDACAICLRRLIPVSVCGAIFS